MHRFGRQLKSDWRSWLCWFVSLVGFHSLSRVIPVGVYWALSDQVKPGRVKHTVNNYHCRANYIRSQVYDIYSAIMIMICDCVKIKLNKIKKMASYRIFFYILCIFRQINRDEMYIKLIYIIFCLYSLHEYYQKNNVLKHNLDSGFNIIIYIFCTYFMFIYILT